MSGKVWDLLNHCFRIYLISTAATRKKKIKIIKSRPHFEHRHHILNDLQYIQFDVYILFYVIQ